MRCFVTDNKGRSCLLELRDAFWVPFNARNLVSVKRMTDKGAMIQFNDDPIIKMHNGTVVLMMTSDEIFNVRVQLVKTVSQAMMPHSIKLWHSVMEHNIWHDVAMLQHDVVGMNISGSEKKTNCNIFCAVNHEQSEDDGASQTDVDDLKSGLHEHCEATSTRTHVIQGESEEHINQMKGHPKLQIVQIQCSRQDVRERLERCLNTSATMCQGEN